MKRSIGVLILAVVTLLCGCATRPNYTGKLTIEPMDGDSSFLVRNLTGRDLTQVRAEAWILHHGQWQTGAWNVGMVMNGNSFTVTLLDRVDAIELDGKSTEGKFKVAWSRYELVPGKYGRQMVNPFEDAMYQRQVNYGR